MTSQVDSSLVVIETARRMIRRLVTDGEPPNGTDELESCGAWADIVAALLDAHAQGGTQAVRNAWGALVADDEKAKRGLRLAWLVSGEPEPTGWRIYTLADAYAPRPSVRYAVAGLFPIPSLSIVYGPPGCFKTMFLGDLAACVAAGLPWLPPLPGKADNTERATLQLPVLWCDFDNGLRVMHERLEAIGRAQGLPDDAPLFYVSMPNPWLDGSDFASVQDLAGYVRELQVQLVVVDNLRDVSGGVDENSDQMGNVMSNFRRLTEETDAALILIHHQRKATGNVGRAGDTLRGHSSIEAAIDLALLIDREEHADSVTVKATKVRGADVLPFGAVFTYEHKPGTRELAKVKFYGLEIEDLSSDAAIRRAILEVVGEAPEIKKTELAEAVKKEHLAEVGLNRIRSQIDGLATEGRLVLTPGDRGAKQYSLPKVREPEATTG